MSMDLDASIQTTERATASALPEQRRQAEQHGQRLRQAIEKHVGKLYGLTTTDLVTLGLLAEEDAE